MEGVEAKAMVDDAVEKEVKVMFGVVEIEARVEAMKKLEGSIVLFTLW